MADTTKDPHYQELVDRCYLAIGKYFVEFSRLMYAMRELIVWRLRPDPSKMGYLAVGETMSHQLRDAFFGMCREDAPEMDGAEQKIAKRLRGFVTDEIEMRNYFAHGDWFPDLGRLAIVPIGTFQVIRIKPVRSDGAIEVKDLSARDINVRSDTIIKFRDLIAEFGMICFQLRGYEGLRVRDVLAMRGQDVVRTGPKAPVEFSGF